MAHGNSTFEAAEGAASIAIALLTPFLRSRRTRWGATSEELSRTWPGDELVPQPLWQATMAVTVAAAPERVRPWIAQLGQGRGGFYSYQGLENLAGCNIENATRVLAEFQTIAVGDSVRLHEKAPPLRVALVQPGRALVLQGSPAGEPERQGPSLETSWALLLDPTSRGATRLLSRTRYRHGPGFANSLMGGPALLEPVSFVMTRKMLRVIKQLAEA